MAIQGKQPMAKPKSRPENTRDFAHLWGSRAVEEAVINKKSIGVKWEFKVQWLLIG